MPLMLASAFPAVPFEILGDVPLPVPAGAPWWAQYAVVAAPAVGLWLFSVAVARLNGYIRAQDTAGLEVAKNLRLVAAILNFGAGNLDKTTQQAALAKAEPKPEEPKP